MADIAGVKVLVVDDTPINLMVAEELFGSLGADVETSNNGRRAIQMVKRRRYGMIFMDYLMPEFDGVEATKEIRALADSAENEADAEYFAKVPIIALTGDKDEESKKLFIEAGMNDYVEKPIAMEALTSVIDRWL